MKTRGLFIAGFALLLSFGMSSRGGAVATTGVVKNVPYVIAFRPLNSQQQPFLGQLHLNFHNGIISGTYTDLSIRPDSPFANAHNLAVSGGVTDTHVTLIIRQVTFRGTAHGQHMSGSTTIRGAMYEWDAHQGTPGSGKK